MITQHAFAILKQDVFSALQANLAQPTGETVAVATNEGMEIEVPVLYGGFVQIGSINEWVAVLGAGIKPAFDAMLTTVRQMNAASGSSVGLLLAVVDDGEGRTPDYSVLDAAMPPEQKANIDAWLNANGFDSAPITAIREVIEYAYGKFRHGFRINDDFI